MRVAGLGQRLSIRLERERGTVYAKPQVASHQFLLEIQQNRQTDFSAFYPTCVLWNRILGVRKPLSPFPTLFPQQCLSDKGQFTSMPRAR